jgi:predicted metallopeptidase
MNQKLFHFIMLYYDRTQMFNSIMNNILYGILYIFLAVIGINNLYILYGISPKLDKRGKYEEKTNVMT